MSSESTNNYYIAHISGGTGGSGGGGGKEGGSGGDGGGPTFQATTMQVVLQNQTAEDREIIKWASPLNFFTRQADIFNARQPGTGEWLFQESLFRKWRAGEIRALWCRGIRAGKTVLASIVVDDLRKNLANQTTGVAVLYLDHKAPAETQSPRNLLAAIWRQLAVEQPIPSGVHGLYKKHYAQGTCLALEETYSMLHSAVQKFSSVFVVVDALDEYPEEQRDALLRHLWNLGPAVRLLMTSRPHVSCDHIIPDIATVEIRAMEEDIRKYVEGRIEKSPRLSRHINKSPTLRDSIEENIVKCSDGMFLLAKLHIDSLMTKQNVAAVKEALSTLSSNLDGAYDAIVKRISHQSEDDRQLALRTLSWVVHAKTPLSPSQLKEALAVEPGATTLDPDRQTDIDIILSLCAGLVVVEEADDQVRLVHYTTQTYFQLAHVQASLFPRAQSEITMTCITYMSSTFKVFSESLSYQLWDKPFLSYTVEFCLVHACGDPETDIKHAILSFLNNWNWLERWWRLWHWPVDPPSAPDKLQIVSDFQLEVLRRHIIDEDRANFLQNAVSRGAADEVRTLLEYGINVEKASGAVLEAVIRGEGDILRLLVAHSQRQTAAELQGHENKECIELEPVAESKDHYGAALYYASWTGNAEFVQLLVKLGADMNSHYGEYGSVLEAAVGAGHESVSRLLIEHGATQDGMLQIIKGGGHGVTFQLLHHGADVNAGGREYDSALQAATGKGHEAIVHLLLQHGANVNANAGKYGSVLQLASSQGHEVIAGLLLKHGADVNAGGVDYGSALQAATEKGHEAIVDLLLQHGANVNTKAGEYGSVLQLASSQGHEVIAGLLLKHGADVNARGGDYCSALQAATEKGHEVIVDLLLQHGANVNAKAGKYGSVLQLASWHGHEVIATLLLKYGADVNVGGGEYGSALQLAAEKGHEAIVLLLLQHGANANANAGKYGSVLQLASWHGHEVIARLLLKHGADVRAEGGEYGNALQAATKNGHEAIVELLLAHGADVNAGCGECCNALRAASREGHEAIVKLLIAHGADVNAQGQGQYGSVLGVASGNGHEAIVKLLLAHGADVNVQGRGSMVTHWGPRQGRVMKPLSDCFLHMAPMSMRKASGGWQRAAGSNREGRLEVLQCAGAASWEGHEAIVKLLLAHGADINAQDRYYSALQGASRNGHEAIVKLLLAHAADVNPGGEYSGALELASDNGHEAIVKLLLAHGADINAQDRYGSALQAASLEGHEAIVQLLLAHGADVNAEAEWAAHYHALEAASDRGHEAIVRLLLAHGADVNAEAEHRVHHNALQAASDCGHEAIARLLLAHGANVNACNALEAASWEGHEVIVKLLLAHGADVNAESEGHDNALCAATRKGHEVIVKLLLEHGANVNAEYGEHCSPLQAASMRGHEAIVKLLLEHGADVNARAGRYAEYGSALEAANKEGHESIVKLLLEHGAKAVAKRRRPSSDSDPDSDSETGAPQMKRSRLSTEPADLN
ncbi:ankyrin repeat-containing domain protein [Mycena capillaripes]|nr:ankyrin repeat-containing domain protein [Mycena capillaripes]